MEFSRRSLLEGLSLGAGSALLLPVLRQLQLEAAGPIKFPLRFVFVLQSNGFHPWAAQPEGVELTEAGPDKVIDLPLEKYKLPAGLAPLEPHKKRVSVVQHLSARHTMPFHTAYFSALSAAPRSRHDEPTATARTIDAEMARRFPAVVPLLSIGVLNDDEQGEVARDGDGMAKVCSAWDAGKPINTQTRPERVYRALYGDVAKRSIEVGGKALDGVTDEIRRAQAELAAPEREKFERYLDAFESLEAQRLGLRPLAKAERGKVPAEPGADSVGTVEANRLTAMFELAGAALIGGLTNVVTICSGMCSPDGIYQGLGFDIDVHPLGHFKDQEGRAWKDVYTLMRQEHMQHIARLVERLAAIPEGDGTIMDNTVIVYTSDAAETHHSKGDQWPFVLIGNAGGRLRSGRYVDYPGVDKEGNRLTNALYSSLIQAAGAMHAEFNLDDELRKIEPGGPLDELMD
jgi:hypothetical protein